MIQNEIEQLAEMEEDVSQQPPQPQQEPARRHSQSPQSAAVPITSRGPDEAPVSKGTVLTEEEAKTVADTGAAVVPGRPVSQVTSRPTSRTSSSCASSALGETNVELIYEFGRYYGEVDPLTGLRSGHGRMEYSSGNVYEGGWRDGAADGTGEKRYANGDVYRGGWVAGKRVGRGGYLHAAGHYFEGVYADDTANGYGVLTTVSGDRYAGGWRNGKKEGKGRETLQGGQVFIGHWRNGKKQGRGKLFVPDATQYIYGIWNEDRFFRELTAEEMGLDAEVDIVDQFGVAKGRAELEQEALELARSGRSATAAGESLQGQSLPNSLTQRLMSGVTAMEDRLEALGRAIERVTGGGGEDASAQTAPLPNEPAPGASTGEDVVGTVVPDQPDEEEHDDVDVLAVANDAPISAGAADEHHHDTAPS